MPVVLFSEMFAGLLGYTPPEFPGSVWISPALGTVIFLYGGWPFLTGGWSELKSRQPGMMPSSPARSLPTARYGCGSPPVGENTALAGIQRLVADAQASSSRAQALADREAAFLFNFAAGTGVDPHPDRLVRS